MSEHRNPRARLSKRPTPDNELDGLIYILRDNLRRADAFVSTAERQIEENWHDDDSDEEDSEEDRKMRHRMRIEYLVEAGKFAVRGALNTAQQIDAVIASKRRA